MRRPALVLVALGAAAAAAGCGVGAGEGPEEVRLTVTRDFGTRTVGVRPPTRPPGQETVMRLLQRSFDVRTRYGGGFVQSIEGLSGGREDGRPVDWFYYVNGLEADEGAASVTVRRGDRIWWDRHDWGETNSSPAVVGSFPEPFRSGTEGKRRPVRIDCAPGSRPECEEVRRRLAAVGVAAATAILGARTGTDVLRVVVGPWPRVAPDAAAREIAAGPARGGVFVRAASDAPRITVLDQRGRAVRDLAPGEGLVAATRVEDQEATWLVTGIGPAGVRAAAGALREDVLTRRFAVTVSGDRGRAVPVVR